MAGAKIMRQLHADHRNMAKLLAMLEVQLERLAAGEPVDFLLTMDIVTYMTEYPDVYHHPKEDLLFSRWLSREPGAEPVVDELGLEHRSIARAGIHLLELLRAAAADVMQTREQLVAAGRRYVNGQRTHMIKEESQVFPTLTAALGDDDWTEVDRLLAAPDDPLFGKYVSESFHQRYAQIRRLVARQ